MKNSISICLSVLVPFLNVQSIQASYQNGEYNVDTCTRQYTNGYSHGREEKPLNNKLSQAALQSFEFNKFLDKDPYDLEDEHQKLFKAQDFIGAAQALIGSAANGESDNKDYLLKLDAKALTYFAQRDSQNMDTLVLKVAEDLRQQYSYYSARPTSLTLPAVAQDEFVSLSKKE